MSGYNPNDSMTDWSVPSVSRKRNRHTVTANKRIGFDAGLVIPRYCRITDPMDTVEFHQGSITWMQNTFRPFMLEIVIDEYDFYVTFEQLYGDMYRRIIGENTTGAGVSTSDYQFPTLVYNNATSDLSVTNQHLAAYLYSTGSNTDIGTNTGCLSLSAGNSNSSADIDDTHYLDAAPYLAYIHMMDELFRHQDTTPKVGFNYYATDTATSPTQTKDLGSLHGYQGNLCRIGYHTGNSPNGGPWVAPKLHDYFTTALRQPQKSQPIPIINFSNLVNNQAPLDTVSNSSATSFNSGVTLSFVSSSAPSANTTMPLRMTNPSTSTSPTMSVDLGNSSTANAYGPLITGSNLVVDLAGPTTDIANSMWSLRKAMQVQLYYELNNTYGTRPAEFIAGHFGAHGQKLTMYQPEILSHHRYLMTSTPIPQTSESTTTSPQGNVSAYNHHQDNLTHRYTKHCDKAGVILGVTIVRHKNSYQNGVQRQFKQRRQINRYVPEWNNIGEQPIYNYEVWSRFSDVDQMDIFGFQKAFMFKLMEFDTVVGDMRDTTNLNSQWNPMDNLYADANSSRPLLNTQFIQSNTKATLANVQTTTDINSFVQDIGIKVSITNSQPVHETFGFIDHLH